MKRRDFLEGIGVAGAAAAVGTGAEGCATTSIASGANAQQGPGVYAQDMDAYLTQLDNVLGSIDRMDDGPEWHAGPFANPAVSDAQRATNGQLAKSIFRSLTLAGMYADLDEADRMHPGMQARLWASADEVTRTCDQVESLLTSMSPAQRGALRDRLRGEPDLMNQVHAAIDRKAAEFGLPAKRRRHLRVALGQTAFRLREQDPGLLFDEFTERYARLKQQARVADEAAAGGAPAGQQVTTLAPMQVAAPEGQPAAQPQPARVPRSTFSRNVGLVMMGAGVGVGLLSIPFFVGNSGLGIIGAVVVTIGVLAFIGGLIALIVAAVQWGNGD